jgi:uncharacterized protein YijF (DUF1287 family)
VQNILKIILYVCLISSAIWIDEVYFFVTSFYAKLSVTDNRNEIYYEELKEKINVKKRLDNVDKFVTSAKSQIGKTLTYNPEYVALKYPMGDINISKGVCTDVVIRALRGLDIYLQERIYEHKKSHSPLYKGLYGSNRLNPNIDHRRVKNIQVYLRARGYKVKEDVFQAGDIVVWKVGKRFDHIGICSSRLNSQGEPYIIHNIGSGAKEENVLRAYKII